MSNQLPSNLSESNKQRLRTRGVMGFLMGIAFGVVFAIVLNNIALGISLGLIFAIAFSSYSLMQANKDKRN